MLRTSGLNSGRLQAGCALVCTRSVIFEATGLPEQIEQVLLEQIEIPELSNVRMRRQHEIAEEALGSSAVPLAGACTGDVLLSHKDGREWSIQMCSELSVQLLYHSIKRVHQLVNASDEHTLSAFQSPCPPTTDASKHVFMHTLQMQLTTSHQHLTREFHTRFRLPYDAAWAQLKGIGQGGCALHDMTKRIGCKTTMWYADQLVGLSTVDSSANIGPTHSSNTDVTPTHSRRSTFDLTNCQGSTQVLSDSGDLRVDSAVAEDACTHLRARETNILLAASQVCSTLIVAHKQELVSGDLSPQIVKRVEMQQQLRCTDTDEDHGDWIVRVWMVGCSETGPLQVNFRTNDEALAFHKELTRLTGNTLSAWPLSKFGLTEWDTSKWIELLTERWKHAEVASTNVHAEGSLYHRKEWDTTEYVDRLGFDVPDYDVESTRKHWHDDDETNAEVDKDLGGRSFGHHCLLRLRRAWPLAQEESQQIESLGLSSDGLLLPARRICLAFCKHRPEIGFSQGMAPLAILLLLHMPEEAAFWTFAAAYGDHLPYLVSDPGTHAIQSYMAESVQMLCPELLEHLEAHSDPDSCNVFKQLVDRIALPMVLRLSCESLDNTQTLSPYVTLRILDVFFVEGPQVILATAVLSLLICKDKILSMKTDEDLLNLTQRLGRDVKREFEARVNSDLIEMILDLVCKLGNKKASLHQGLADAKALASSALLCSDTQQSTQECLKGKISWFEQRLQEHNEYKQQFAGSVASTAGTEMMTDWARHVQAHTAACLWKQAAAHNVSKVSELMGRLEVDLPDTKDGGATALHKAVKSEASIMYFSSQDKRARHNAKAQGELRRQQTIDKLARQPGADVNFKMSSDGSTALHLAAWADGDSLAVMITLLGARALVGITDDNGMTALHIAAGNSNYSALMQLLMSSRTQGTLAQVVNGKTRVRELTPLHMVARGAAKNGCTRSMCCQALLEYGADPTAASLMDETVLHTAARWGDRDLCKALVQARADVNATTKDSGFTPLHCAVEDMEVMPTSSIEQNTSFFGLDCCLQLLKLKAKPDAVTAEGWSPLLLAARRGNAELCDLLVRLSTKGTNLIAQTNDNGWGPLHMAVLSGSATTCQTVLKMSTSEHKEQEGVVHLQDGTTTQMKPSALAVYLNENSGYYTPYSAAIEFGRTSVAHDYPTLVPAAAAGEDEPKNSFVGVLRVFEEGLNIEDEEQMKHQKADEALKAFSHIF